MSPAVVAFNRGRASARRIQEVLRRQPAIDARAPGGARPTEVRGNVVLDAVRFAYPARPKDSVFESLDLEILVLTVLYPHTLTSPHVPPPVAESFT